MECSKEMGDGWKCTARASRGGLPAHPDSAARPSACEETLCPDGQMAKRRVEKSRDCHSFIPFFCNEFAHRGEALSLGKKCLEGRIRLEFRRTCLSLRGWFLSVVPIPASIHITRELARNTGS